MAKYAGVAIGAVTVIIGIACMASWWKDFVTVLKGSVPLMLVFCGAVAVIAGLAEMKDEAASKEEEKR